MGSLKNNNSAETRKSPMHRSPVHQRSPRADTSKQRLGRESSRKREVLRSKSSGYDDSGFPSEEYYQRQSRSPRNDILSTRRRTKESRKRSKSPRQKFRESRNQSMSPRERRDSRKRNNSPEERKMELRKRSRPKSSERKMRESRKPRESHKHRYSYRQRNSIRTSPFRNRVPEPYRKIYRSPERRHYSAHSFSQETITKRSCSPLSKRLRVSEPPLLQSSVCCSQTERSMFSGNISPIKEVYSDRSNRMKRNHNDRTGWQTASRFPDEENTTSNDRDRWHYNEYETCLQYNMSEEQYAPDHSHQSHKYIPNKELQLQFMDNNRNNIQQPPKNYSLSTVLPPRQALTDMSAAETWMLKQFDQIKDWNEDDACKYGYQIGELLLQQNAMNSGRWTEENRDGWTEENCTSVPTANSHDKTKGSVQCLNSNRFGKLEKRKQGRKRNCDFNELADLIKMRQDEPAQLLMNIILNKKGFVNLLSTRYISDDMMPILISIIDKALSTDSCPASRAELIREMLKCRFIDDKLPKFLVEQIECPTVNKEATQILLENCINIAEAMINETSVFLILSAMEEFMSASDNLDSSVTEKLMSQLNKLKKNRRKKHENRQPIIHDDDKKPVENFRNIPILPQINDIHSIGDQFLRENKKQGKFTNLDHYLDVHFRLMREDCFSPLREGIRELVNLEEGEHPQNKDIRVYTGVTLRHPVCSSTGMLYKVKFNTQKLRHVRWGITRRLIFGSLLCFSNDNFQTVYFASVAERSPKDLECGIVYVKFETNHDEVACISPDIEFSMVESSAYFEAYRHVLKGLQQIQESMCFQKYIVFCETNVQPPLYLRKEMVTYDIRPLVDEEFRIKTPHRWQALSETPHSDVRTHRDNYLSKVVVLDAMSWPSYDNSLLDDSQYKAVKGALTKEFSIIQGPPGTGKTYIGLEIVKTLLHNRQCWETKNQKTIMVVCYTNHALDQFLEGIQNIIESGIVRVGGRSKNKNLKACGIKEFRREDQSSVPEETKEGLLRVKRHLKQLETDMVKAIANLKATESGIINPYVLESVISRINDLHFTEILQYDRETRNNVDAECFIIEWLGLYFRDFQDFQSVELCQANLDLTDNCSVIFDNIEDGSTEEDTRQIEYDFNDDDRTGDSIARPMDASNFDRDIEVNRDHVAVWLYNKGIPISTDYKTEEEMYFLMERDKYIRHQLQKSPRMELKAAKQVTDIWRLAKNERWDLYRLWLSEYRKEIKKKSKETEQRYQHEQQICAEFRQQEDICIMKAATILGMTTTGAARQQKALQEIKPKIVIVEEAAEVLESHIITTLSDGCEHLILIGDHKQLRPNPTVHKLATKFNLNISLFERMINNGLECNMLQYQHRMRPEIAEILKPIYKNLKDHHSVHRYRSIAGIEQNMFFIDHDKLETSQEDTHSYKNEHEAEYIVQLYDYLIKQGYRTEQITILTTYTGQMFHIRNKIRKESKYQDVLVTVVDNYQGEENDIILLSLVRSNPRDIIGFIRAENRVCVALSRAKMGLYVIGNITMFARNSTIWRNVYRILEEQKNIGQYLELYCQNHKDYRIKAATAVDFEEAPDGGCLEPCRVRLPCGHRCGKYCHYMESDPLHEDYKCKKPCTKTNPCGHKCERHCYENCLPCKTMVNHLLQCGHDIELECWKDPASVLCEKPCKLQLPCGHRCQSLCGELCSKKCYEKVQTLWLRCGHQNKVWCYINPDLDSCPETCKEQLECGHNCSGKCGSCFNGRLHKACEEKCSKILICGHRCRSKCNHPCPPCRERCQTKCPHSECQQKCGDICVSCMEPCQWECPHHKCNMPCGLPCDRPPCNEACNKQLLCGHTCIGICGEPCPTLCRICNRDEVTDIFFGTEDEEDARFVQLQDCSHCLEVSGLDHWMGIYTTEDSDGAIQHKPCPKCKSLIQKSMRYNKQMNVVLQDLNRLKEMKLHTSNDMLEKLEEIVNNISDADEEIGRTFKRKIMHNNVRNIDEIQFYINTCSILKIVLDTRKVLKQNKKMIEAAEELERHASYLVRDVKDIEKWCLQRRTHEISNQQVQEALHEAERIELQIRFVVMFANGKIYHADQKEALNRSLQIIQKLNGTKLTADKRNSLSSDLNRLLDVLPKPELQLSEEERLQIVKAVGLSQGHWFKCPNGKYLNTH